MNEVKKFIDSQSALIHFDGTIYDTSGLQGILFSGLSDGKYFVNIIHRNHLAVGSAVSIPLSSSFDWDIRLFRANGMRPDNTINSFSINVALNIQHT